MNGDGSERIVGIDVCSGWFGSSGSRTGREEIWPATGEKNFRTAHACNHPKTINECFIHFSAYDKV